MKINNNVFEGEDSLIDYLNPINHIYPLVELPSVLNPYKRFGVRIYAKLLQNTPLLNVKSIPAYHMIDEYNKNNDIKKIDTLIESSSGNTVYSLGIVGRVLGINKTISMASSEVTQGKLKLLQFFGIETIINEEPICPDPNDSKSGINIAKIMGKEKGKLNLGQYDNENNRRAHYNVTGPQIFKQLKDINLYCAGLGTTGTFLGTSKYLKEQNNIIVALGVVRKPNNPIPGPRTRNLLNQIAFEWEKYMDNIEYVGTVDAYKNSLLLCRYGILGGPSSGMNLKGLFQYIENNIDEIKKYGDYKCVFVCCDTPFPYIEEYFRFLPEKEFPEVFNNYLLKNHITPKISLTDISIDPKEFIEKVYNESIAGFEKKISNGEDIIIKNNCLLIDLRTEKEFSDHRIPGFINVDFDKFEEYFNENKETFVGKEIYLICSFGEKSNYIGEFLHKKGVKIFNILGGTVEWSNRNYPRIKFIGCKK